MQISLGDEAKLECDVPHLAAIELPEPENEIVGGWLRHIDLRRWRLAHFGCYRLYGSMDRGGNCSFTLRRCQNPPLAQAR